MFAIEYKLLKNIYIQLDFKIQTNKDITVNFVT